MKRKYKDPSSSLDILLGNLDKLQKKQKKSQSEILNVINGLESFLINTIEIQENFSNIDQVQSNKIYLFNKENDQLEQLKSNNEQNQNQVFKGFNMKHKNNDLNYDKMNVNINQTDFNNEQIKYQNDQQISKVQENICVNQKLVQDNEVISQVENDLNSEVIKESQNVKTHSKDKNNIFKVIQNLFHNLQNVKPLQKILKINQDNFVFLSKLGKLIEKIFEKQDQDQIFDNLFGEAQLDDDTIYKLIFDNLFTNNILYDPTDDDNLNIEIQIRLQDYTNFQQVFHQILFCEIDDGSIDKVLEWIQLNKSFVNNQKSQIEYHIFKFKFIELIKQTKIIEATQYAQINLIPYMLDENYNQEIQQLITLLVFAYNLDAYPYQYLISLNGILKIKNEFTLLFNNKTIQIKYVSKQFDIELIILDITLTNCLEKLVNAGYSCLPQFQKFLKIRQNEKYQNELPFSVELDKNMIFHSDFVCPVSKESFNEDNPPVALKCGHVILKNSMIKLSQTSRYKNRFKCPYCPIESKILESTTVYF